MLDRDENSGSEERFGSCVFEVNRDFGLEETGIIRLEKGFLRVF